MNRIDLCFDILRQRGR